MTARDRRLDLLLASAAVVAFVVAVKLFWSLRTPVGVIDVVAHAIVVPDSIDLSIAGPRIGSPHARTVIVEFSDFQCPYCRKLQAVLDSLLSVSGDSVAVVFRHLPGRGHPHAFAAAVASECAAQQLRFSQYAAILFAKSDSLGRISFTSLADRAGVADTAVFSRCLGGRAARARVEVDARLGRALGLPGTPTTVIGKRVLVGVVSLDSLRAIVSRSR